MQQPSSWIARWSAQIIEISWLAAIFCIPSFFNLLSSRHFEPDKALLFRSIVVLMSTFVVINTLELRRISTPQTSNNAWWQHYKHYPLMIAIISYCGVFILSTISSIVPDVSFWGSYQRLQGTYTNLSYVALALIMMSYVTTSSQMWRIVGMLLLGSVIPTAYGYIQHFELDPLPWKGDVITRVASTLGNSIFIAAYLILIVPFALAFGVRAWREAHTQITDQVPRAWVWVLGHTSNLIALITILFGGMQMTAVIRSIDTLHWWIYPGAIGSGFAVSLLVVSALHQKPRFQPHWIVPAVIVTLYTSLSQIVGVALQDQFIPPDMNRFGANWNWWMWCATLCSWIGVVAYIQAPYGIRTLKPLAFATAYASFGLAIANWVTIILSQSRGPWIGGAVGLFLFLVLFALHQIQTNAQFASMAKRILIITVLLFTSIFGFLLVFNFANIPALQPLRDMPYIGRMGRLFDISPGTTGDVRMKIWFGDTFGSGTVGLILSNPIRTLIGWGPESMFAAYTPFYPPSLANIESRSATPDRAHQAFLDELVNKGVLGLISYLAVIALALRAAWRSLRNKNLSDEHVLIIALISSLVSHLVEGLTGIPIVNSLMIQWLAIALIIRLDHPRIEPVHVSDAQTLIAKSHKTARSKATTNNTTIQTPLRQGIIYVSMVISALVLIWSTNISNMYADMRFQQGQTYNSSALATNNNDQQIIALSHYLVSSTISPRQDFYYLNIGRSLLNIADARRRQNNTLASNHVVDFRRLLQNSDPLALKQYLAPLSARDITRYAEESLLRANELYPLNKDHSANLARLYLFWFNRIEQDQRILDNAITWFSKSTLIAPNDVSIINDYAGALILYASVIRETDSTRSNTFLVEAETQLTRSQALDQRYRNTTIRLGDLARAKADYQTAIQYYDDALTLNPRALDSQITSIINQLAPLPETHDFLRSLRQIYARVSSADDITALSIMGLISSRINDNQDAIDAFAQLTALQPDNLEAQQNYTLVLSNAKQYDDAYAASDRLYTLAQQSGYPKSSLDVYDALRAYFASKINP